MIINITPFRAVLFEKYNIKNIILDILVSNLDGCVLKTQKTYQDQDISLYGSSVFYCKNGRILFEEDLSPTDRSYGCSKVFWTYAEMWSQCFSGFIKEYPFISGTEGEYELNDFMVLVSDVINYLHYHGNTKFNPKLYEPRSCYTFKEENFYDKYLNNPNSNYEPEQNISNDY